MVMNINIVGFVEGLGFGYVFGFDFDMLCEVFFQMGVNLQVFKMDGEDMQNWVYDCYFFGVYVVKDSGIVYQFGLDVGFYFLFVKVMKEQFDELVLWGLGGLDKSGVVELIFKGWYGG